MNNRVTSIVFVSALVGIGAFALLRTEHAPPLATAEPAAPSTENEPRDPSAAPTTAPTLPPGHPDIGQGQGTSQAMPPGAPTMNLTPGLPPPSATGPGALTWKAPPAWTVAPNPSPMRLATYKLPRAAGDSEDVDVAITRAGGGTEPNIQRWLTQFSQHAPEIRTVTTVRGLKVTVVDVSGTYGSGGMMPGDAPSTHPNWTLLAAIVETEASPYFIKITGPSATVHAARTGLDSLIRSLTPAS
jgi:hypothetical protein